MLAPVAFFPTSRDQQGSPHRSLTIANRRKKRGRRLAAAAMPLLKGAGSSDPNINLRPGGRTESAQRVRAFEPTTWPYPREHAMKTTTHFLRGLSSLVLTAVLLASVPTTRAAPAPFPHLGQNYEVVGTATPRYNCIAWVLGHQDRWLWPGDQVALFDRLFAQYGYRKAACGNARLDFSRQPGMDKIVLYARRMPDGSWSVTHSARQLPDGTWSSKLGELPLIRHRSPEDVDGGIYGVPVAVYTRPHQR
jgi:hypothetical protein